MISETSPQAVVASVMRHPNSDTRATDPVVALRTLSDLFAAFELYKKYLADHILNHPLHHIDNRKKLCSQYGQLSDLEALIVLSLIWKESCFLSDKDLFCAGLPRKFPNGINRQALGKALLKSDRRPETRISEEMFARRAARIVEAAITYGLVENGEQNQNVKYLNPTSKLDNMLREIGSAAATLIHEPFGCTLGRLPCSANGAGE